MCGMRLGETDLFKVMHLVRQELELKCLFQALEHSPGVNPRIWHTLTHLIFMVSLQCVWLLFIFEDVENKVQRGLLTRVIPLEMGDHYCTFLLLRCHLTVFVSMMESIALSSETIYIFLMMLHVCSLLKFSYQIIFFLYPVKVLWTSHLMPGRFFLSLPTHFLLLFF